MADKKRCVVTGLGLICGVGDNVKDCWDAVTLGHSGIDEVKSVDTSNCYAHKGAEVDKASSELSPENYDRSSLLCIHAANEAFEDASIDASEKNIGVILGSCVGGAASIDKYYTDEIKGDGGKKEDIFKMGASAIANNVSAHFGLEGITANIVNACAAGTMSIGYACDLIREGKGDVFIAGGSDSFSSLAFSGFHALHALDENACSPFNHSTGITLGEGSGILVIESYEHAVERGAKIYCEILGSGVSSDAYHITAPRPDGEGQMSAIRRAVESSALTFDDIDYINAHGTGTAKNDEAEFLSLHTLFDGNDHLSVSSTKSMTGHCLGAAGSIEAVFSVKAIKENLVPPTIGYSDEDLKGLSEKAGNIDFIPNKSHTKDVHYAMSNSFAFGGNNASIIFSDNKHDIPDNIKNEKIYITGISKLTGTKTDEHSLNCNLTSEDYDKHGIKVAFYRKLDRFSQLQLLSGMDALTDADIKIDKDNEYKTGIVIGTADGPMTEIVDFQKKAITRGTEKGSAFSFPNTVYNAAGGYLSIFSGIKGYNATVANGNQAGLQSICYAADILADGNESVMLAAGTDENTKTNLELYTKAELLEKPLGEGSVTLVLETEESANGRNARKYAEIKGYAQAHRPVSYDNSEVDSKAVVEVIEKACVNAGIEADNIDFVCCDNRKIIKTLMPCYDVSQEIGNARAAASAMTAAYAAELLSNSEKNYEYGLALSMGAGGTYSAVILKKA